MAGFVPSPFLPSSRTFRPVQHCVHRPFRTRFPCRVAPCYAPPRLQICASAADTLVLTENNVDQALEEARVKLGSVFGNSAENREIGITGNVDLVELDGPVVVLRLRGRFWHKRADVLARVAAFLTQRIPEICDVTIEDIRQLDDSEEESARLVAD